MAWTTCSEIVNAPAVGLERGLHVDPYILAILADVSAATTHDEVCARGPAAGPRRPGLMDEGNADAYLCKLRAEVQDLAALKHSK